MHAIEQVAHIECNTMLAPHILNFKINDELPSDINILKIEKADSNKKLLSIYGKMKKEAFFRYEINLSKFDVKQFSKLEIVNQKRVLLECLDKNHLYVNYSDINDTTYKVSPEDKKLNKLFYGE